MVCSLARILVPTDFSETADAALAYAKALASRLGASVHLLHVFSDLYAAACAREVYSPLPPQVRAHALQAIQERLLERMGSADRARFGGTTAVATGLAAKEIVRFAAENDMDLIVIGTHGRRGVAHLLLGSVAEHVVRTARCPVLTVRGLPVRDVRREEAEAAALVA